MELYKQIREHQINGGWSYAATIAWLHSWRDRIVSEFKLEIADVLFGIGSTPMRNAAATFRNGHNSFGILGEIIIDTDHVKLRGTRHEYDLLGTVAHELLHAWQCVHGTPGKNNYHNAEYRDKALEVGMVIDSRGITQYLPESPLFELLSANGVFVPPAEELLTPPPKRKKRKGSKLKLWECQCPIKARVAVPEFPVRCEVCNARFKRKDS